MCGSRWLRWDLHVHAPGTLLNDQYEGGAGNETWERWLQAIEACKETVVLGVTEYFILDTFEKVWSFKKAGRLFNIKLLLPNLEFRFDPPNDKSRAVQFHLLLDPTIADNLSRAKQDLSELKFRFSNNKSYPCSRDGLIELGRACLRNGKASRESDAQFERRCLEEGAKQFKPSLDEFIRWLSAPDRWLRQHAILVMARGNDGPTYHQDGWQAVRDRAYALCDAVFSSSSTDRDYWLGKKEGTESDRERYRLPKPCIHGSDAHSFEKLLCPDFDRKCWIKAEPTFRGLRQILIEPEERVHIGGTPPQPHDLGKIVRELEIKHPDGAFPPSPVPFHPGLTAIIGQRGSGKSALVELLAFAANADPTRDEENVDPTSFLARAKTLLEGTTTLLQWADRNETARSMAGTSSASPQLVFLPQAFIELLAEPERAPELLQKRLHEVLFSAVPADQRGGTTSYRAYWESKTRLIHEERKALLAELDAALVDLVELDKRLQEFSDLERQYEEARAEVERLRKLRDRAAEALTDDKTRSVMAEYKTLKGALAEHRAALEKLEKRERVLEGLEQHLRRAQQQIEAINVETRRLAGELALPEEDIQSLTVAFREEPRRVLDRHRQEIEAARTRLKAKAYEPKDGSATAPLSEEELTARIKSLSEQLGNDEERRRSLQRLEDDLAKAEARLRELDTRRAERDSVNQQHEALTTKTIPQKLQDIVRSLFQEVAIRQELVDLFRAYWKSHDPLIAEMTLDVALRFRSDDYLAKLIDPLNKTRKKVSDAIERSDSFEAITQGISTKWGDLDQTGLYEQLVQLFQRALRLHAEQRSEPSIYRSGFGLLDLLRNAFSFDFFQADYTLQYGGVDVSKLSAGMKGVVLLALHLDPKDQSRKPIVIDQPDANLDSRAVVDVLCPLIRRIKRDRQIVIVTHNPNLVVNTDAELVIVAESEAREPAKLPKMRYRWGALEGDDQNGKPIKDTICEIMEGGAEAFLRRERRYALPDTLAG